MVWTGICEWTGFLLVAALAGWVLRRYPAVAAGTAETPQRRHGAVRLVLLGASVSGGGMSAGVIVWILLDPAFERLGHGHRVVGFVGTTDKLPRGTDAPGDDDRDGLADGAADGAGWQYAALAAAVLLTSSDRLGSPGPGCRLALVASRHLRAGSVSMMTLLTGFGLARVLPQQWRLARPCHAPRPCSAALALLLAVIILIRWLTS